MEEISSGRALQLLNREWYRLRGVIDTRAAEAQVTGDEDRAGMASGLILKRVDVTKKRRKTITTTTYTLDCKTLRELRALERHAMKESAAIEAQDQKTAQQTWALVEV